MTLEQLNTLDVASRAKLLHDCCGSRAWVGKMLSCFPVADTRTLFSAASVAWHECSESDWLEAFSHHPKIGAGTTDTRAATEQSGTKNAPADILTALAAGNQLYEQRFGYIYIICATGRSAREMLEMLQSRLGNTREQEIHIAMNQQEKITLIRLQKLLS